MKHLSSILILAALLGSGALRSAAEEKSQVLEGRLVDLMCYTMNMSGDKHAKCGMQCAQKGLPVGLLEEKTGKLYTVLLPSPGLAPHLEKTVRLTGRVQKEVLLTPDKLEIREGEEWKAVELPVTM